MILEPIRERKLNNVKQIIFVSKNLLNNNTLSSEGLLAYIAIRYIHQDVPLCINSDFLCSLLVSQQTYVENRKLKEKMNRGIQELIEKNLIVPLYSLNKNNFVANCNNIKIDTKKENFVILYISDIRKIMKAPKIQHDKLLLYFTLLMASINSKNHIGFTSSQTFAEKTNMARKTICNFNDWLEDSHIISFNKSSKPIKYCSLTEVKNIKNFVF